MSDDDASFRRRRRRDGDPIPESNETPVENDASEPQADAEGADWLLSQLEDDDTERTQAIPVTEGNEQVPSRRADGPAPDLTPWWRSTAPTSDTATDAEADGEDDSAPDAGDEPSPRRRSTFQAFTPALPEDDSAEAVVAPTVEPGRVPVAEPEPIEPEPIEPEPIEPEPIEPEPVSAVVVEPHAEPTPLLFKPRPDADRPWVTRPVDGQREPAQVSSPTNAGENSTDEVDLNDSAPFVWSLSPNDQLDPIVHKSTSDTAAPSAALSAAPSPDDAAPTTAESSPADAAPSVEPVFLPAPAFVPEPATPPVPTETVVIPEIVDDGPDENDHGARAASDDDDIIDAEIVESESDDDEPVTTSTSATPRTATLSTDDVDSLAFLMGLEEATAATVAFSPVEKDELDEQTENVPTYPTPVGSAEDAEPLARRRAAEMASPAAETPTALFPPVGPFPADPTPVPAATDTSGRPPLPPYVKWIALGVVALLVLVGLFLLGTRLPSLFGAQPAAPAPSPSATATPTATPTPTEAPAEDVVTVGPVAPGEHKWTALLGSECLEPYSTPWAENFMVVDCATPHRAQMVFTAPVTSDPAAPYPGEAELASQIALWCSAPGVFDTAAAGAFTDLQVQGTYPVSDEQWADGERNYYCFLSRSSNEPLTGSLAVAQPAT
ncbi:hypothetical protein L1277_001520 [Okibacterium sp. HSC-33S16]|uniref:hypothetical protein n=1 Tax=Okibacterium sp. HSC-33S16 TaxID=2910965 RepID=UPI00209D9F39|nr:hypothetical protein [Okibacterium sp. HSC-33S16]MCP2031429.1 hypothetical protein [Okibacterium sp. HSC-33S16]